MATAFPTSLDSFTNPTANSKTTDPGVVHSEQHANANDAIEALQAKVGITASAVTSSHEFRLTSAEAAIATKQAVLVSGTNIRSINGASLVGAGDIQFPTISAFVRFDGANGAVKSGFNVSAVTKTSTGTYTIQFATPLNSLNYALVATPVRLAGSTVVNEDGSVVRNVSSVGIVCLDSGVATDGQDISVMVIG